MSVTAPATPAAPAPGGQGAGGGTVQPASGQGQGQPSTPSVQPQGQGQPQGGGFWGNFPNIPEGQRELLEPHLRQVQGYVTQLEQRNAPYQSLMEAVQPDSVNDLVTFLQNYNQDPVATWLGLGGALHEAGHIENPQFSIDSVQGLLQAPQAPPDPTMPEWAQQLQQRLDSLTQDSEARNQTEQQRQAEQQANEQKQMLAEAHSTISETLKNAGLPEGLVTPEMMTGALVSHRGDVQAAAQEFITYKEGLLKSWVEQNSTGPKPPTVNGGMPTAPKQGLKPKSGDGFRAASRGAEQFLRQNGGVQE